MHKWAAVCRQAVPGPPPKLLPASRHIGQKADVHAAPKQRMQYQQHPPAYHDTADDTATKLICTALLRLPISLQ